MPQASWLSERVLLTVGLDPSADEGAPLAVKALSLDGLARSDGLAGSGVLHLIRFSECVAVELPYVFEDLRSFCRSRLAVLSPEGRRTVLAFLVESLLWDLSPLEKMRLAMSLRQAREALRERLPLAGETQPDSPSLNADSVVRVDDVSFYATGAVQGDAATLGSLVAVSPEGSRIELAGHLFGRAWPTAKHFAPSGFAAYFSLPVPSHLPEGWKLEMRGAGAQACEAPAPLVHDLAKSRRTILDHLVDGPVDDRVMEDHVVPALCRMQAQRRSQATIERVVQFGRPVESTQVTIVVAFDHRIAMLEHQIAQLARDPAMQQADLIYVLDSDSPGDSAIDAAAQLHDLYRVPFRLVTLARQAGFAAAIDVSVSRARGRLIVLLGSHVLPDRPGWLTSLAGFHDAEERLGAVGAKLLGPDAAVLHAGFTLMRAQDTSRWQLRHRAAGAGRRSAAARRPSRVQAVSASCLMIDRERLERAGGLSGKYVQRDFEVADLCLRLKEAGHDIWSCADVELYDLDLQRADRTSRAAQIYDEWVYTNTWRAHLDASVA